MGTTYPDEWVEKITDHRRNILKVLDTYGRLRMEKLRERVAEEYTELPSGSRTYHTGKLEEWGLIESGRLEDGERVFELTPRGEQFVMDHLGDNRTLPSRFDARLDDVEDRLKRMEERHEKLIEKLEGEFWDDITYEIDRQIEEKVEQ